MRGVASGDTAPTADLAMLTDRYSAEDTQVCLDHFWKFLRPEGLLLVDYIHEPHVSAVFETFCRVKNRESQRFNTRYGVGMVLK